MATPAPPFLLRGVLEDGDARPLSGARIACEGSDEETRAAADGTFALRVPSGRPVVVLAVSDRGRAHRVIVATDAPDGLRVVVVPADAVPLRVLTPATAPVPTRFGWFALREGEPRAAPVAGDSEDGRGRDAVLLPGPGGEATAPRFAARGLAPGRYALVVWGGPFLPTVVEGVVLDGSVSAPLTTVELMRRGASVAGRVYTPTKVPRPGVALSVRPADPDTPAPRTATRAVTDAGGRWRIEGLPAGRYTLVVDVGLGGVSEHALQLLEREERAMDLVP